jgi:hypothetical protein
LRVADESRLQEVLRKQGRVILAIDGSSRMRSMRCSGSCGIASRANPC